MTLLTRLHKREEELEQRVEELEWAPITEGEDKCAEDDGDNEGDRRLGPFPRGSRTEPPQECLRQSVFIVDLMSNNTLPGNYFEYYLLLNHFLLLFIQLSLY